MSSRRHRRRSERLRSTHPNRCSEVCAWPWRPSSPPRPCCLESGAPGSSTQGRWRRRPRLPCTSKELRSRTATRRWPMSSMRRSPPVDDIETYPVVVYEGVPVYYVGGTWYRHDSRGWGYYRREPRELAQQRETHDRDRSGCRLASALRRRHLGRAPPSAEPPDRGAQPPQQGTVQPQPPNRPRRPPRLHRRASSRSRPRRLRNE